MKATDLMIQPYLEGSKQFIIPLFQRPYKWERKNILRLWDDLVNLENDEKKDHFFGSFVVMPLDSAPSMSRFLVIDGQQRLITIQILLAAIRDRIKNVDSENTEAINYIHNNLLINQYKRKYKFKIIPSEDDKEAFFHIIDNDLPKPESKSNVFTTYNILKKKLLDYSDSESLEKLETLLISNFAIVDITLNNSDNEYLIFESLNATGMNLTQTDLIRNFIFMKIKNLTKQKSTYNSIWLPIERKLGKNIELFTRQYLSLDGDLPRKELVYDKFKKQLKRSNITDSIVIKMIKDMAKYADYYEKILDPEKEDDLDIRSGLLKINELNITVVYPLLMKLYDCYINGNLTNTDFDSSLKIIESYLVRRQLVGLQAKDIARYFPKLQKDLDENQILISLEEILIAQLLSQRWPTNTEIKDVLLTRQNTDKKLMQYIFQYIENHLHNEATSFIGLQLEHIMPQTLSDEWKESLGSIWELTYRKYLNNIGNLTFTGYNPNLSNKLFIEKRDMEMGFKNSNLFINRFLGKYNQWTDKEIVNRAKKLIDYINEIWNHPL